MLLCFCFLSPPFIQTFVLLLDKIRINRKLKKCGAIVLNVVFLVRHSGRHRTILFKAVPVGGGVNKEMKNWLPSCSAAAGLLLRAQPSGGVGPAQTFQHFPLYLNHVVDFFGGENKAIPMGK